MYKNNLKTLKQNTIVNNLLIFIVVINLYFSTSHSVLNLTQF